MLHYITRVLYWMLNLAFYIVFIGQQRHCVLRFDVQYAVVSGCYATFIL